MDNTALFKKIIIVLLVISISSLIWSIGSNARKKVELEKSHDLSERLEKLIKSNTVITTDLKKTTNTVALLKRSDQSLKESLAEIESKNQFLETKIKTAKHEYNANAKALDGLKSINASLNEKLTKLKVESSVLQKELKKIKMDYQKLQLGEVKTTKTDQKKVVTKTEKTPEVKSTKGNFSW